ncbi:MAG TPA: OsmC family protein [Gemmatimonadaceae bacterium]|nr:OsmC family protein [Gemmatimonadaceae bacterium]
MKITLLSDESIRLEPTTGHLTVEAESADQPYSPYQMLASGLATCTFGVLQSWASNAGISADDLVIDVTWSFVEKPHRVGAIELSYQWPSLPADRQSVAQRVAELCPLHKTLIQSPTMTIRQAA